MRIRYLFLVISLFFILVFLFRSSDESYYENLESGNLTILKDKVSKAESENKIKLPVKISPQSREKTQNKNLIYAKSSADSSNSFYSDSEKDADPILKKKRDDEESALRKLQHVELRVLR